MQQGELDGQRWSEPDPRCALPGEPGAVIEHAGAGQFGDDGSDVGGSPWRTASESKLLVIAFAVELGGEPGDVGGDPEIPALAALDDPGSGLALGRVQGDALRKPRMRKAIGVDRRGRRGPS